jgi:hypothetical protein
VLGRAKYVSINCGSDAGTHRRKHGGEALKSLAPSFHETTSSNNLERLLRLPMQTWVIKCVEAFPDNLGSGAVLSLREVGKSVVLEGKLGFLRDCSNSRVGRLKGS